LFTSLDQEIYKCRDCRVWEDGHGFCPNTTHHVVLIRNGMTLSWGNGSAPLHTEMALCPAHLIKWNEAVTS
jgi:hypothetical protein